MKDFVDGQAALLVNREWPIAPQRVLIHVLPEYLIVVKVASRSFPGVINHLLVVKLLENTVAAQDDEIVVVPDLEAFYVRCRNHALWITAVSRIFGFDVTYGP